ncbi:MAG TPA: hypothetical protein VNS19_22925 [Acidimicrobiales bacterium]|nr:hypothetical protein [Acidimicrobiales bacterium]
MSDDLTTEDGELLEGDLPLVTVYGADRVVSLWVEDDDAEDAFVVYLGTEDLPDETEGGRFQDLDRAVTALKAEATGLALPPASAEVDDAALAVHVALDDCDLLAFRTGEASFTVVLMDDDEDEEAEFVSEHLDLTSAIDAMTAVIAWGDDEEPDD